MTKFNGYGVVHESHVMVDIPIGSEECKDCDLCLCHSDLTKKCIKEQRPKRDRLWEMTNLLTGEKR